MPFLTIPLLGATLAATVAAETSKAGAAEPALTQSIVVEGPASHAGRSRPIHG